MGIKDTKAKEYLSNNERFADLFNYYIFQGEQIIKPEDLHEKDTAAVLTFYGINKKEIQKQKWRDILKSAIIKTSKYGVFVLMGIENQSDIHYAMPVKNMIYDAMEYGSQVKEAASKHKKEKDFDSGAEFLSGFKKSDRLTPVITLTVYWGADKWDAPRSLHEMFDEKYEKLMKYVDDYHLHLIVPNEISDFELFRTSLGEVLEFIKVSNDEDMIANTISKNPAYMKLENDAVSVINVFTGIQLSIDEKGGTVNMCKGWDDHKKSGMDVVSKLNACLIEDGRMDDLIKSSTDLEYRNELIEYYGLDQKKEPVEV